MSESVALRLRRHLDPETLLPSLRGRMESERNQRASERIWKFELSPWTPVPVCVSAGPTPSALGETGQGNGVRESACCSASLRAADKDHHECQALTFVTDNRRTSGQIKIWSLVFGCHLQKK